MTWHVGENALGNSHPSLYTEPLFYDGIFIMSFLIITVFFCLSFSSDHDSEGKRVQDMLSAIEKPQVGIPLPTTARTHTFKPLSSITSLSDAVTAGLSSDDFSVCLFGLFESHENEMLTFRIISILTCICSTFLIFNVFWGAWAAGRVIIIYAVLMLATWGQHLLTQAAHSVIAFFLPWGECDWMNELLPCRHGLLERNCSFQVKTVWSACCAHLTSLSLRRGLRLWQLSDDTKRIFSITTDGDAEKYMK